MAEMRLGHAALTPAIPHQKGTRRDDMGQVRHAISCEKYTRVWSQHSWQTTA